MISRAVNRATVTVRRTYRVIRCTVRRTIRMPAPESGGRKRVARVTYLQLDHRAAAARIEDNSAVPIVTRTAMRRI